VTVLEARNRVGGRVLSFHDLVPGGAMEGGAELIGTNHPIWMDYRQRFGLAFVDITEEDAEAPIVLNGRRLSADESERLWKDMQTALNGLDADAATVPDPFEPWTTPGAAAWDRRSLAEWIQALDAPAVCKAGLDAQMVADNGVTCAWQSYLGNLAMIKGGGVEKFWTETEVYRCAGGSQQLALKLAKELGPARVLLRTPDLTLGEFTCSPGDPAWDEVNTNMGAWPHVKLHFDPELGDLPLEGVSRPESAAPSVGQLKVHQEQHADLLRRAFA